MGSDGSAGLEAESRWFLGDFGCQRCRRFFAVAIRRVDHSNDGDRIPQVSPATMHRPDGGDATHAETELVSVLLQTGGSDRARRLWCLLGQSNQSRVEGWRTTA
ncbi:hypothetical protein CEK00_03825 [Stenotrophomonas maltophilia]|uniref:Uncharacterized protein n=1 Tax=Stenotrophomonas maltophilia TaxID=40324 RepID=A0A270NNH9_STEMA|nr:hypothetical protein CEK00_03825 [Stenotrophomonas maltophilia]